MNGSKNLCERVLTIMTNALLHYVEAIGKYCSYTCEALSGLIRKKVLKISLINEISFKKGLELRLFA